MQGPRDPDNDAPDLSPVAGTQQRARADRRVVRITLTGVAAGLALLFAGLYFVRTRLVGAFVMQSESMRPTLARGQSFLVNRSAYKNGVLPRRGDIVVFDTPPEATDDEPNVQFVARVVALPGDTVAIRGARISLGGQNIAGGDVDALSTHDWVRTLGKVGENEAVRVSPDHVLAGAKTFSKVQLARLASGDDHSGTGRRDGASCLALTPGALLVNGRPQTEPFTREDPGYDFGPVRLGPDEVFVLGDNRNRARDSHVWGPLSRQRLVGRILTKL